MAIEIRRATSADRPRYVETVLAAFADDPAFRSFFGDGDQFRRRAGAYVGYRFDDRLERGAVWLAGDGDAVAAWDRPTTASEWGPSDAELAAREVLGDSADRIAAYDRLVHTVLPDEPHWYLGILACHPRRRGAGLARLVADVGLGEARRNEHLAVLETSAADNVRIYESAGWSVHATLEDVLGMTIWVMTHKGRSAVT